MRHKANMLATRNDAQKEKPMVGGVFAGVAAFKNMLDMARALKDMSDATNRNSVAIEL
jgi:hypothetical protein